MSSRCLQTAAIGWLLFSSGRASATEPSPGASSVATLAWARAEGADKCVDGAELQRRVTRRLGRDPFVSSDAPIVVEGTVRREGNRWRVELLFRDAVGHATGKRALASADASCAGVTEATVLALALAIDPAAAMRLPGSAPSEVTAAAPLLPPPAVVVPPEFDATPRGFSGVVLSGGVLPSASVGVEIGFSAALGARWRLGLRGVALPEARTDDGAFGFGITSAVASAEFRALSAGRFVLAATGGAWAGIVHSYVHPFPGIAAVAPGDYGWVAADVGVTTRVEIFRRVDLALGGSALFPLTRIRALVRGGAAPAFNEPAVGFVGELSVGARF